MKKLTDIKVELKGDALSITGKVTDALPHEFRFPVQQTSVGYLHPSNQRHPRHVQLSGEGVFVKAALGSFVLPLEALVEIAGLAEPKTLPPPSFAKLPSPENLVAELAPDLSAVIQWKWSNSDNPNDKWTNIDGATSLILTTTPELKGKWVSCVAENDSGAIATPPILI